MYATTIFIRRRSQEIGLYQFIGLSKAWVARVLILEHTILGLGALLIGTFVGTMLSRLFLLLLMNLLGLDAKFGLTFSGQAFIQTIAVFTCLLAVTTLQILWTVYRSTLLQLFQANHQHESFVRRPSIVSAILGGAGIGLIGFGYYVSTFIGYNADTLVFIMLIVLGSTILGTYFVFHTTISWILYVYRKKQNGNLGLVNSLSIASLMHRMKGHANSLTLITILSAMTITMTSLSYSLYYSIEKDVRLSMPFDFAVENMPEEAAVITSKLADAQIEFEFHQVHALRFDGAWVDQDQHSKPSHRNRPFLLFSAEQMSQVGLDLERPQDGEAIYHSSRAIIEGLEISSPWEVQYASNDETNLLPVSKSVLNNVMNYILHGDQLIVNEETFERMRDSIQEDESKQLVTFEVFNVLDAERTDIASDIFRTSVESDLLLRDFYSTYEGSRQNFGLLIFIAGFLGLVFILSTGSILYFKQMTEAEQEKTQYRTLRQLGFQVDDIMKGIIRKQLFVYLIPLVIGLTHAAFALKVGSILIAASMLTPILISMAAYILIYLVFTVVTIRYYKNIVIHAL
ncbi:FtsX-like permease family protein [Paenibacillus amylolyticus]|nr:FtsX-like permease family protein [Paenibacillus amylolyticus]WFR65648.1 FtsX-like permease family protein [Paenibacillus amylolyticus]